VIRSWKEMLVISDYSSLEKQRRIYIFNEKWRFAFQLYLTLGKLSLSPLIFVRNCSHYFSAHERGRQINMTTFLEAFYQHGRDISSVFIRRVFRIFDTFERGYIDWRELAFMLTCIGKNSTPLEDLCNAFKFYTGHNSIDIDCIHPRGVRLQDIELVMSYILSPNKMQDILLKFYNEWGDSIVDEARPGVAFAKDCSSVYIHATEFRKFVAKISSDIHPHHFEEEYYPKLYSRLKRTKRLIKLCLMTIITDALRSKFHHWKYVVKRKKMIGSHLLTVLDRANEKILRISLFQLRQFAVQVVIVIAFQRLFRRYRTRLRVALEHKRQKSATLLQSIFRRILAENFTKQTIWNQNVAAVKIQRSFRGYLGRMIAWKRIQTKINERERKRKQELERLRHHTAVQAAIRIQRYYKARYARKQLNKMIHKRRTVLLISREMDEYEKNCALERAIASKQAAEQREAKKTQLDRIQMEETKFRAQKQLLLQMQRKIKLEEDTRLKKMNDIKIKSETRSKWEKEIEMTAASYRKYCQECLKDPKTKSDRQFKKHLHALAKKRIDSVLKRADDRGIQIELDAARKVSQIEVIEILVRAKRDEMEQEMKKDLERLDQELSEDVLSHSSH
jgi:hypothetical protein